jgi:hypothetical protein
MKSLQDSSTDPDPAPRGAAGDEDTGLTWIRSWGGIYLFVFCCFLISVALLVALSAVFS